jgi:hypothetical protein
MVAPAMAPQDQGTLHKIKEWAPLVLCVFTLFVGYLLGQNTNEVATDHRLAAVEAKQKAVEDLRLRPSSELVSQDQFKEFTQHTNATLAEIKQDVKEIRRNTSGR